MSTVTSPIVKSPTLSSGSTEVHSTRSENVQVQSVVQCETHSKFHTEHNKKIEDLMARLESTHVQVEKYSRKRTEEINEAVAESIKKIVSETLVQQQQLLADVNLHTATIENEYKAKLQEYIAKLDNEKAVLLVQLEKDLDARQQLVLDSARKRIDDLHTEANRLKINVLKEAQAQSSAEMCKITEQVAALEHEEGARCIASTTTTVIKTKSVASGDTHFHERPVAPEKTTTDTEVLNGSKN